MSDATTSDGATISVAEVVGRLLAHLGVGHAFGVVGSGNFEVTNALRAGGVCYTAMRHEGGAATAADAYSRLSGKVGVVSVHQGCGLTNATTGICEAAKSRTPLLVLAAEAAGAAVMSNFAMDQAALARSVQAVPERVHGAESVVRDVVRAFRTARNGRRTVVLNLPLDVQQERVDPTVLDGTPAVPEDVPVRPGLGAVVALADLLSTAERPVLIAGRGARQAGAELRELAAQSGALLATSAVANGLFEGDPYAIGISGGFSSPLAAELIQEADLIVGFGCALNMWTMRHGRLIGKETLVAQVDDDEAALGTHRPIALGVRGDSAQTARAVIDELRGRGLTRTGYRTAEVRALVEERIRWRRTPTPDLSTGEAIDPRVLSMRLDDLLPDERVVSIDSGNFMGYPSSYLRVPDENAFVFTQAFQSIGLGLSTSIGAALAQPHRIAVLGTGDGGFLMGIAELETAVRLGLPLLVVVYNDASYGAEVHHFAGAAGSDVDLGTVTFPDTDIAALARGFGAQGATVRTTADLGAVSRWLESWPTGPLVIDAKIASDGGSWWLHEAFQGH